MSVANRNKYSELQTVRQVACFRAIGKTFVNGISNKYQQRIPKTLKDVLPQKQLNEFVDYFDRLNNKIGQFWPCSCAYYFGYVWCPFTLGISLCLPLICIKQVEAILRRQIKRINQDILKEHKLEMRLVKKGCSSKILISLRFEEVPKKINLEFFTESEVLEYKYLLNSYGQFMRTKQNFFVRRSMRKQSFSYDDVNIYQ